MKYKVIKINIDSKYYPERLKNIACPPKQLYCLGNLKLLNCNNTIGIIGSRNCSKYGEKVSKAFGFNLAKQDMCVISGLAKGIDSFSHNRFFFTYRSFKCKWKNNSSTRKRIG